MKKALFLAVATQVLAGATMAQTLAPCLPRDQIVAKLASKYSEQLAGRGLKGDAALFEVFRSDDGATWTIIKTLPSGLSCIMASGEHWIDRVARTPVGIPS